MTDAGSGSLRIRRRCPSCGAPIEHSETDGAVACPFCAVHLAIVRDAGGSDERLPRFAIPARIDEEAWALEAKRLLRREGRRVRQLYAPRLVYAPFLRLSCSVYAHWQETHESPPPEARLDRRTRRAGIALDLTVRALSAVGGGGDLALESFGSFDPGARPARPPEFQFRVGRWEQTLTASPTLPLPDRTLGVRTQALAVVPLDELVDPDGDAGALPGRLRHQRSHQEIAPDLERQLRQAHTPENDRRSEYVWEAPGRTLQWIYYPYALLRFDGPGDAGEVLLDGVSGKARSLLPDDAIPESALEVAPGTPQGWRFSDLGAAFVRLVCPTCSMPLPMRAASRIYACSNCRSHWRVAGGKLDRVAALWLCPADDRASGSDVGPEVIAIPFYRLRGDDARAPIYVPAAESRHPRALWNLATGLTRIHADWRELEPCFGLDTAVALDREEAAALGPFAASCVVETNLQELRCRKLARARGSAPAAAAANIATAAGERRPEAELVWLRMRRHGADWVEPWLGLAVPARALVPWDEPNRSPGT